MSWRCSTLSVPFKRVVALQPRRRRSGSEISRSLSVPFKRVVALQLRPHPGRDQASPPLSVPFKRVVALQRKPTSSRSVHLSRIFLYPSNGSLLCNRACFPPRALRGRPLSVPFKRVVALQPDHAGSERRPAPAFSTLQTGRCSATALLHIFMPFLHGAFSTLQTGRCSATRRSRLRSRVRCGGFQYPSNGSLLCNGHGCAGRGRPALRLSVPFKRVVALQR